jgi:hypothetical protein
MKCNKTQSKWCINKHGASKIIDTFETYQGADTVMPSGVAALLAVLLAHEGGAFAEVLALEHHHLRVLM